MKLKSFYDKVRYLEEFIHKANIIDDSLNSVLIEIMLKTTARE